MTRTTQTEATKDAPEVPSELWEQSATDWLEALRFKFTQAGFVVRDNNAGWLPSNHRGSVGWAVGDRNENEPQGRFYLHLTIDGKAAGIRYRDSVEYDDDEQRDVHDPVDANKLNKRIGDLVASMGRTVTVVSVDGYQRYWDHDVHYSVVFK